MGWIIEPLYNDHEGWVANVLADGRVTGTTTGSGVVVYEVTEADIAAGREIRRFGDDTDRPPRVGDRVEVVIPWDQVKTWRVTCECGWTGPELPATPDDRGWRDCPEEIEERVFAPAWQAHVEPLVALSQLSDLAQQSRQLERQLAEKVRLARSAGASWTEIGRETRLTRQGAQQRWGSAEKIRSGS